MNVVKLKALLQAFFEEDIASGDITTNTIFSKEQYAKGSFVAKADGVFCGSQVIEEGFQLLSAKIQVDLLVEEGQLVKRGDQLCTVKGPVRELLSGERVILNLVQKMSGIATLTNVAVKKANGESKICDTRKTTPGLRMLEKYAVTCGGGFNHRFGLYDAVMIKDNHIAAAGGIKNAVAKVKAALGHTVKIEVETETKEDVIEAVEANADIIMFDNRTPEEIIEFIKLVPSYVTTEASGGITLDNVSEYAKTKVNYISLGFLTHSASALDISFNFIQQKSPHFYK